MVWEMTAIQGSFQLMGERVRAKRMGARRRGLALCAAVMVLAFISPKAYAALQIDITQGNIDPLPIAVVDFLGPGSQERQIGIDVAKVIGANLERSGLFRPLPSASYI